MKVIVVSVVECTAKVVTMSSQILRNRCTYTRTANLEEHHNYELKYELIIAIASKFTHGHTLLL